MSKFKNSPKAPKRQPRKSALNTVLLIFIVASLSILITFYITLLVRFIMHTPFNFIHPGLIWPWDKERYGCYQAAEMYGFPKAVCHKYYALRREDFHGWLDPRSTNYTLGISVKEHWLPKDYRSFVRDVVLRTSSDVSIVENLRRGFGG